MKLAKISPLYKSGDRFDAKNYRPVAVLPALSKVIEKIVISRLKRHLEKHKQEESNIIDHNPDDHICTIAHSLS